MEMEIFAKKVKSRVGMKLGTGHGIRVCGVTKNNGVQYTGLQISGDRAAISPVIYIDSYYDMYMNGETTVEGAASLVTDIYNERKEDRMVDIKKFLTYDSVVDGIVYKLINTERNRELLEDVPHRDFMDLSVVYEYLINSSEHGSASILVHNAHMKLWDVTEDVLYRAAEKNTGRILGYDIKTMNDVICGIMESESPEGFDRDKCMEELSDSATMYVLSNRTGIYGATCMLYPDLIRNLAGVLGGSMYIIPSSVHELLLLPADGKDEAGEIKGMIREINDTQVKPEEILSYSLYYYDIREKCIYIC